MRHARPTPPANTTRPNRQHHDPAKPIPQAALQPLQDELTAADQADDLDHPMDSATQAKKKSRSSSHRAAKPPSNDSTTASSPPPAPPTGS
jgi:hypothetical protein